MAPSTAPTAPSRLPCDPVVSGPAGVRIIITHRHFDPRPGTPHLTSGERLQRLASQASQSPPNSVVQCHQVHGTHLLDVDGFAAASGPSAGPDADGLTTRREATMIVVRTADCVPVVLAARRGGRIAALHCGWRGTIGGLLDRAVALFISEGLQPRDLWLWIGPRICGRCYEVGGGLADQFRRAFPGQSDSVVGDHVDLGGILAGRAEELGVPAGSITLHPACTREAKELFPSHRRDANNRGLIYTGVWKTSGSTLE